MCIKALFYKLTTWKTKKSDNYIRGVIEVKENKKKHVILGGVSELTFS